MNLRNFKPKLLAVAVLTLLSGSVFAAVEYTGTPDAQIPLLKTYGVDVPTKNGLKSVLPQGWTLLINKTVTLPELMSWKPGDPWTQALEDVAIKNNLALKLDWSSKTVTIQTPDAGKIAKATTSSPAVVTPAAAPAVASAPKSPVLTEHESPTRESSVNQQAAMAEVLKKTPVPVASQANSTIVPVTQSYDVKTEVSKMAAPVVATAEQAPAQVSSVQKQVTTNTTQVAPPAVAPARQPELSLQPRNRGNEEPRSTVRENAARAQVGGSALDLTERMASRFNYTLSWETSDVTIPGAITLLGQDIAEDAKLLQHAIGYAQTPLSIQVYRSSQVIRVIPRSMSGDTVAIVDGPFNGRIISRIPGRAVPLQALASTQSSGSTQSSTQQSQDESLPVVVVKAPAKTQVIDTPAPAQSLTLTVQKGDSLTNTLKTFFVGQGWDMQWKAPADLQATYPVTIEASDMKQMMGKLLPKLGLVADFYNPSKLVVIRSLDVTTN